MCDDNCSFGCVFQLIMFSLLKFEEPEVPEVVPTSWLHEDTLQTKWPPYDDTRVLWKAIINLENPKEDWDTYSYEKILFRSGKKYISIFQYILMKSIIMQETTNPHRVRFKKLDEE